jgi:hypothetical protein
LNFQPGVVYLQKVTHHEPAWGEFYGPKQQQKAYTADAAVPGAH